MFARDGELIPVTMLPEPTTRRPVAGVRVLSAETAQAVREMLQLAAGPGGTAPKAQAHRLLGGRQDRHRAQAGGQGLRGNKYRAWFVGMAPISNPRIVVAVMVDEPSKGEYFGGDVAAPVFSQVVQQTLRTMGVPPDIDVKPQIVASTVAPAEQESF